MTHAKAPRWMRTTLLLAAGYNILWGAHAVLLPGLMFDLLGMPHPNYPFLWQCIGMIVGVYGVGYAIAATEPLRHWPIVLVGLLGKIFGPIGFVWTYLQGGIPANFGYTIITNDLIWWVPFALILLTVAKGPPAVASRSLSELVTFKHSSNGRTFLDLSAQQNLLVVFLRHTGCTFCREAMSDLKKHLPTITGHNTAVALVHMSPPAEFNSFAKQYGLEGLDAFSDPERELYSAFELTRGSLWQLFGPAVWLAGLRAFSHGVGALAGDGFQMPGAFVMREGKIIKAFRHQSAGERPDYCELASSEAR
jgi:peroxiredoxin